MKRLKDPVYGYIEIDEDIMSDIVDTAPFQRLRRICQTGYGPLYASAVHNRFVHSLGVFHLGVISIKSLEGTCKDLFKEKETKILTPIFDTFKIACLLHDVGHAPFSHTGEEQFVWGNSGYDVIHEELKNAVDSCQFNRDIPKPEKYAAPHEIMSAIVGIQEYGNYISDKELFARCITGYQYSTNSLIDDVKNCFIQLLNSRIIDVDKLDYLTRDAYITGYDTVKIDYYRLLSALTIEKIEGEPSLSLAYKSSAVSVIENVVYAHDSERKWIQNHPVILYESYLLNHSFQIIENKINKGGKLLFSKETLSVTGEEFDEPIGKIRLLSDDDIIFLMKHFYEERSCIEEYFCRNKRKHPIWKSETEYRAFFLGKISEGEVLDDFDDALKKTAKYLQKNTENWAISQNLADDLKQEIAKIKMLKGQQGISEEDIVAQKEEKTKILKVVECLLKFALEKGYFGDFVLLRATQFSSGFNKPDFSKIPLVFVSENRRKIVNFEKVAASFSGRERAREDFFYIYYDRSAHKNGQIKIETKDICGRLLRTFVSE